MLWLQDKSRLRGLCSGLGTLPDVTRHPVPRVRVTQRATKIKDLHGHRVTFNYDFPWRYRARRLAACRYHLCISMQLLSMS